MLSSADLASWVQAVGSVAAIAAFVYIVNRQHRLEPDAENQRRLNRVAKMNGLIAHAWSDFHALKDKPDDPSALARHWRDKSNNYVQLQLAQIQFHLDQLRALPLMDLPSGRADVENVYELNYALIVAKSALERKRNDKPVTEEVIKRVSDSVWRATRSAAMPLLRSHAQ